MSTNQSQTTLYNKQYVSDLYDANYFGDDSAAHEIQQLWLNCMARSGYEFGVLYDADEFDVDAQKALETAIGQWNCTKADYKEDEASRFQADYGVDIFWSRFGGWGEGRQDRDDVPGGFASTTLNQKAKFIQSFRREAL